MASLFPSSVFAGIGTIARDVLANSLAYACRKYGPYASCQSLVTEDEMDINEPRLSVVSGRTKLEGRYLGKGISRRFRGFVDRLGLRMPVANRRPRHAGRIGLLRASVLGANDGILSISSLLIGVAAAHGTHRSILVAGISGLVAGAMSMAASEYVSVHSQADTEEAELALQRTQLKTNKKVENDKLTAIYVARGLEPVLAKQVAQQLIAFDELGAYAREELGISEKFRACPRQASLASASSFAVGGAVPLLVTAMVPVHGMIPLVSVSSLVLLALLGGLAARAGGAGVTIGALRVTFWGGLAMAMTAGIGWLFGAIA